MYVYSSVLLGTLHIHGLQWLLNRPPRVCALISLFFLGMNQNREEIDVFWVFWTLDHHNASADF